MFQVARSLGILDEVNRMKVVPGASPSSSLANKNVRYMEVNTPSRSESRIQVWSGSSICTCTLVPESRGLYYEARYLASPGNFRCNFLINPKGRDRCYLRPVAMAIYLSVCAHSCCVNFILE